MGKVLRMTDHERHRNQQWNQGYSLGYNGKSLPVDASDVAQTAYLVGIEDRIEDEEAIASGTYDHLSNAEREWLFGTEEKASEYRSPE